MAHETVLKTEAVDALVHKADGTYADCTYGRGGHSREILMHLAPSGRLLVMDKDVEAVRHAERELATDQRVVVVHGSFKDVDRIAAEHGMKPLDGILLDLGVSSPQLDDAGRGFSFDRPGPLDMRMNQQEDMSAKGWLSAAGEQEIIRVLKEYGEERFARRIARAIVETRDERPIETTAQLVELIEAAVPRREKHKHPATRSFQAIRIHVNRELEELKAFLDSVVDLLATGGRLVIISFHSLEDRMVKRFMRDMAKGDPFPARLPITDDKIDRKLRIVGRAIKASEEEIRHNRRSRSAVMRVAERLG